MGNEQLILERGAFVDAAVTTLLYQVDLPTLLAMVAGGEDEFISHAREHWTGHGFTHEEYRHAFRLLVKRSEQVSPTVRQ
tara:strand:- start:156 stop:395 length:240 start_codon:yes stop_codon:yes gene_type:complete